MHEETETVADSNLAENERVQIADATVEIRCWAAPQFIAQHSIYGPLGILFIGSIASIILAGFLRTLIRERSWLEASVLQRTEELAASEQRFRAIFEASGDAMMLVRDGRFADCNWAAVEMFGCSSREELCSHTPSDLSPPKQPDGRESQQLAEERLQSAVRFGRGLFEWTHRRLNGETFPAEVLLSRVDVAGETLFVGAVRDITKRRESEDQLRKLSSAVEHSPASVVITDLDAKIEYVNPAFCRLTGYTREEVLGKTPRILRSGYHSEQFYANLWEILQSGKPWHGEICNQKKNGERFWEYTSIALVRDTRGQTTHYVAVKEDITERKHAMQKLHESETRLRAVFDNVQAGVLIIDRQTRRIVDVNPAALRMIGRCREDVLGKACHRYVCPSETNSCPVIDLQQTTNSSERVLLTADGQERVILKTAVPIALDGRECLLESFVDVTDRKSAEDELAFQNRLAMLRADVGEELARTNSMRDRLQHCCQTIVDRLDAAFARVWTIGDDPTVLELQASAGQYTHIDGSHARLPVGVAKIGQIASLGQPHLSNDVFHDPQISDHEWAKRENMVSFAGYPLIIRQRVVGVVAMFARHPLKKEALHSLAAVADAIALFQERDDAERKLRNTNRKLKATTSFQQAILDSAEHEIFTTDLTGIITTFNRGAERMLGYSAGEVLGRLTPAAFHDPNQLAGRASRLSDELGRTVVPGFEALFVKARLGKPNEAEWTAIRKDGTRFPLLLSLNPLRDEDGEILGFMGIGEDVSIRKQTQEALRVAKDEAEEASRAKSDFLATMSHELRTPLNGVIGMSDLLRGTQLDDRQRRFVDACHNSAMSLLTIINDILDFSKIEAGKLELDEHEFDLQEIVDDVMAILSYATHEKKLELNYLVAPQIRCRVVGDSSRFRQVLVNLLNNAVKFTSQGEITVRTVPEESDDETIVIRCSVADTGIGIPVDRCNRLFQPFSQVDRSTARKFGGTGLGLAICRNLVTAMGGRIGVESTEGEGSTFWFTAKFRRAAAAQPLVAPRQLHELSVLVAEPNDTNRSILMEILGSWGIQSVGAATWTEAVGMLAPGKQQLCIGSIPVGGTEPLDLARQLAEAAQAQSCRLFLLVSPNDTYEADIENTDGVDKCLQKPIGASKLFDAIIETFCGECPDRDTGYVGDHARPQSTEREGALVGVRVLVAEDNKINRMYIEEVLRQAGCEFTSTATGEEALRQLRQSSFDLVLMDCQMPQIDGFEATRRLRQLEQAGELPGHLPVVALTANAVKGDRDRCLDAGMDDYVTKPIDTDVLIETMRRLLPEKPLPSNALPNATAEPDDSAASSGPPIDREALLARCMGNAAFACSLLDELKSGWPAQVDTIGEAVEAADAETLAESAHSLKGAAGIVEAKSFRAIAAELEAAGRAGDLNKATGLVLRMRTELQRCLDEIPAIRFENDNQ